MAMQRRRSWTFKSLESLESRDLPSASPALGALQNRVKALAVPASLPTEGGSGVTADPAAPRPNEVARRAFVGRFSGKVVELRPRLVDEARQFLIVGPGSTNQFLHGTLQLRYFTPQSPATQTTGVASMADRNESGGAVLLLDLTGDPAAVDAKGRPKRFDFVVNGGGGSGGIYASSVGAGTLTITYRGNKASVLVQGSVYTSGIGNPLQIYSSTRP